MLPGMEDMVTSTNCNLLFHAKFIQAHWTCLKTHNIEVLCIVYLDLQQEWYGQQWINWTGEADTSDVHYLNAEKSDMQSSFQK